MIDHSFFVAKTADSTPELNAFAKGFDAKLIAQMIEFKVEQNIAINVICFKAVDDSSIHLARIHPVDDLKGIPLSDLVYRVERVQVRSSQGSGDGEIFLSLSCGWCHCLF